MKIGDNMNMNVDYRVRAVAVYPEQRLGDYYMPAYQKIFYGLNAETIVGIQSTVFDLSLTYTDLSVGGRRPGRPVEMERQQHFFTKHMGRSYHDVQDRGDPVRAARLPVEASSLNRLEQAASQETRNSGGHRDDVDQADNGRQASYDAKDYPL